MVDPSYISKIEVSSDNTNWHFLTDTNIDHSIDPDDIDVTTHGDNAGFKEMILGLIGWNFTISGILKDELTGFNLLETSFITRPTPVLYARYFPNKDKTRNYKGKVVVSSLSHSAGLNEAVTFSATLTGTEALTITT